MSASLRNRYQRQALHREQGTLAEAVSQAARFGEGRSELLSDLLALLTALQATGIAAAGANSGRVGDRKKAGPDRTSGQRTSRRACPARTTIGRT